MKSIDVKKITMKSFGECNLSLGSFDDQLMNISKEDARKQVWFFLSKLNVGHLIFSFSHIFWIGDLNYRIADNIPRQMFDTTDFSNILKSDQLYQEMQKRRVFKGYTEGPITFRPSYRYDPGTDDWDSR